jgi:hypothetical protein
LPLNEDVVNCVVSITPVCCVRELIVLPEATKNERDVVSIAVARTENAVTLPEDIELVNKANVLNVFPDDDMYAPKLVEIVEMPN